MTPNESNVSVAIETSCRYGGVALGVDGQLAAEAQNDTLSTYAPMLMKNAGLIDWSQSTDQIDRHIRAMTPWPSAFTGWQGTRLKVLLATPLAKDDTQIVLQYLT